MRDPGARVDPPAQVPWERVFARPHDPFAVEMLASVHTREERAEATRRIDYHYRRLDYPAPRPPITRFESPLSWVPGTAHPSAS